MISHSAHRHGVLYQIRVTQASVRRLAMVALAAIGLVSAATPLYAAWRGDGLRHLGAERGVVLVAKKVVQKGKCETYSPEACRRIGVPNAPWGCMYCSRTIRR